MFSKALLHSQFRDKTQILSSALIPTDGLVAISLRTIGLNVSSESHNNNNTETKSFYWKIHWICAMDRRLCDIKSNYAAGISWSADNCYIVGVLELIASYNTFKVTRNQLLKYCFFNSKDYGVLSNKIRETDWI